MTGHARLLVDPKPRKTMADPIEHGVNGDHPGFSAGSASAAWMGADGAASTGSQAAPAGHTLASGGPVDPQSLFQKAQAAALGGRL
jgi:hypothetical protein